MRTNLCWGAWTWWYHLGWWSRFPGTRKKLKKETLITWTAWVDRRFSNAGVMRSLWSSQIFFRSLFIISQIIISIFPSRQLSITLCQQFINITCTQAIHQINILLFSAKRNEAIINWFGTDYRTLQYHVHVASNSDWRDRLLVINRLSYKQTPPSSLPSSPGKTALSFNCYLHLRKLPSASRVRNVLKHSLQMATNSTSVKQEERPFNSSRIFTAYHKTRQKSTFTLYSGNQD